MSASERPKRRVAISSEAALRELALRYVARFPCTTARLRAHLAKKTRAAIADGALSASDARRWTEAAVVALTRMRALDDEAYAEARAATLHRRGRATWVVVRDLARAGAAEEAIVKATSALGTREGELAAALNLARKKRLGPFGGTPVTPELRRRQMATFARAGFGFDLARRILDARTTTDIEA